MCTATMRRPAPSGATGSQSTRACARKRRTPATAHSCTRAVSATWAQLERPTETQTCSCACGRVVSRSPWTSPERIPSSRQTLDKLLPRDVPVPIGVVHGENNVEKLLRREHNPQMVLEVLLERNLAVAIPVVATEQLVVRHMRVDLF